MNKTRFHNIEIYYDIFPSNSFYQKFKDPNVYQPGKLVGVVKDATKIGFAIGGDGGNNTLMENEHNIKSTLVLSNLTIIRPLIEKYSTTDNTFDVGFDITPLIKEYGKGIYTIITILQDQKQHIFPGGERSIFYN